VQVLVLLRRRCRELEAAARVAEAELRRLQEANDGLLVANRELASLPDLKNALAAERAAARELARERGSEGGDHGVTDWAELQPAA
jgi:hypothetical protein